MRASLTTAKSFLLARRLIAAFSALLCALVALSAFVSPVRAADDEPLLKPDVPKMDLTVPPSKQRLRGGVQHVEQAAPPKQKLSAAATNNGLFGGTAKRNDAKLSAQTPKAGLFGKMFKMKAAQAPPLTASVPNGIGIIGVKFTLGMGRPPVINRVFAGTPADEQGLRVDDIIVAVDGVPTNGLSKDEVYGMIVGRPDTTVTLSLLRHGDFLARTMQRMDFNDISDPLVKRDYMLSM